MVLESSLTQQATAFAESLNVRPAPSVEKTDSEQSREAKVPEQGGDVVTISDEARALIAPEKSGNSGESKEEKDMDQTIQLLEKQIEKLEEELESIKKSDLPEKQKLNQIQEKEAMLMELREQLLKAKETKLKAEGMADGGGTRANGFGNSVDSF